MKSLTQNQVIEVFGDYNPFLSEEGLVSPEWERQILLSFALPAKLPLSFDKTKEAKVISCHKLILPFLRNALTDIHQIPDVWNTINDYGGVYNFRVQRKSKSSLSKHCWAIAIDMDVGDNPFGKEPKVHPKIVEIFSAYGFIWGGNFRTGRKDGMHFEFADIGKL